MTGPTPPGPPAVGTEILRHFQSATGWEALSVLPKSPIKYANSWRDSGLGPACSLPNAAFRHSVPPLHCVMLSTTLLHA
jgi:hypothetical protein